MRLLVAAATNQWFDDKCVEHNISKLFSALTERKNVNRWPADKFLMVDSGAYSWNKSTLGNNQKTSKTKLPSIYEFSKGYIKYIEELKDKPFVFVELDCYGILPKDYLDDVCKEVKSIGGNFQYMRVYHPILDGGSLNVLKKWIDEGHSYIGLGNDSRYLYDKIFTMTKHKVKYHGFAVTKDDMCIKYPFYSCDSSTVISARKYGSCYKFRLYQLLKKEIIAKRKVEAVIDVNRRMEDGLIALKKSEHFYTSLWKKRGVEWKD